MIFSRSSPSFFELTCMLLQDDCINNGVTNGLKQKKEKNMQTALYGKTKERRETEGEWLIGANTQIIRSLSIVARQQDQTKACKAPTEEVHGRVRRVGAY